MAKSPSALELWGEVYYRLHRLVKRWRTQVLQVEQQHTRFIQAIQASPYGVLMLDDADQIEWCNGVAEQHFGLNARRDVRQRITHLIRRPEFIQYLTRERYDEPLVMRDMGEHNAQHHLCPDPSLRREPQARADAGHHQGGKHRSHAARFRGQCVA